MTLVWSDELASILFIWLSMLGAVLALDRGEHMRLTAIINKCSEKAASGSKRWRRWWSASSC
jgi:TRAP-type C4-dicarboxylate transport system permease small subunit